MEINVNGHIRLLQVLWYMPASEQVHQTVPRVPPFTYFSVWCLETDCDRLILVGLLHETVATNASLLQLARSYSHFQQEEWHELCLNTKMSSTESAVLITIKPMDSMNKTLVRALLKHCSEWLGSSSWQLSLCMSHCKSWFVQVQSIMFVLMYMYNCHPLMAIGHEINLLMESVHLYPVEHVIN